MRLLLSLLLVVATTAQAASDLVGTARVVDGDTIVVADTKVRLEGVDAPEHGQTCTADGVPWALAATPLRHGSGSSSLAERWPACPRATTAMAGCFVGGENLNERIVREGWALDFRRYTSAYLDAEEEAKRRRVGLWRGDFEPPWEWRQGRR